MHQFSYADIVGDAVSLSRQHEAMAMDRAVELLELAKTKGSKSREAIDAVLYLRRLWSYLIEDLAQPENDLPEALRADLISIGLWIIKEAEQIRRHESENFDGLIEINGIIRAGLA
ncbi:flagellar biosynthesis regulator FlaF [Flaviflagellibacter deserti]|jgi:flagellar biosynthesis activator protein FlaF|uniref:Flagellar biosynthesis regulator FlaF n=1 Tax=Flaviflagellibacter deserti TaxID=2267266 RepID=A0ABV9Z4Q5_9HYPH